MPPPITKTTGRRDVQAQRLLQFILVKGQCKRGVHGNTAKQNPIGQDSPSDQLPTSFLAGHAIGINLRLNPGRLGLKIGLHRQNGGVEPPFAAPQRGDFRRSNFRDNHQLGSIVLDLAQHLPAPAAKNPIGSRRAMQFALAALKQHSPQPRGVPQHPPIRVHIEPVEPPASGIESIHHLHFNGVITVVKGALHRLGGAQVPRAHPEGQNANALLNHQKTP